MCPKCFFKIGGKPSNYQFFYPTSSNFVTISHIDHWDQLNSWRNFWKIWNGPLFRNKSGPSPVLNVAANWRLACAKKLSQILENNIDDGGRGIGLKIYVRYCSYISFVKKKEQYKMFWWLGKYNRPGLCKWVRLLSLFNYVLWQLLWHQRLEKLDHC